MARYDVAFVSALSRFTQPTDARPGNAEALEQKIAAIRSQQRDRRKQITLRRHPLKTLGYFILVLRGHVQWLLQQVLHRHRTISLLSLLIGIIYAAGLYIESPLQEV